MNIFFGWRTVKLERYKPSQLDFPKEWDSEISIEKRQKYFHVFWIPIFSLGQHWYIRKNDNQLYEPKDELLSLLKALPISHKTPWFIYIFIPFVLLCGSIFFIDDFYKRYQSDVEEKYLFEKKLNLTFKQIDEIQIKTCLEFFDKDLKVHYLKVIKIEGNKLTCLYSNKYYFDNANYNQMVNAFLRSEHEADFDTVIIDKNILQKTVSTVYKPNEFIGQTIYPSGVALKLRSIELLDYPVFEPIDYHFENGKYYAHFKNIGAEARIEESSIQSTNTTLDINSFTLKNIQTDSILTLSGTYTDDQPNLVGYIYSVSLFNNKKKLNFNMYQRQFHIKAED